MSAYAETVVQYKSGTDSYNYSCKSHYHITDYLNPVGPLEVARRFLSCGYKVVLYIADTLVDAYKIIVGFRRKFINGLLHLKLRIVRFKVSKTFNCVHQPVNKRFVHDALLDAINPHLVIRHTSKWFSFIGMIAKTADVAVVDFCGGDER